MQYAIHFTLAFPDLCAHYLSAVPAVGGSPVDLKMWETVGYIN